MRYHTGTAAFLFAGRLVAGSQATVNVFLQSSWDAPPIALELLESIHHEEPSAYFLTLFGISHHVAALESAVTPKDIYTEVVDIVERLERPKGSVWDMRSVKASVAMHIAAPKIEAHYSYYETVVNETAAGSGVGGICESWVELHGKGFCDVESLRADLERTLTDSSISRAAYPQPRILMFDHMYPAGPSYSSEPNTNTAILYFADFSSEQANLLFFLEEHHRLDPTFRFVVRYRPSRFRTQKQMPRRNSLKGYGVEMVLKRTDYLVVDDRETGTAGEQVIGSLDPRDFSADPSAISSAFGEDPWSELATPLRPVEIANLGLKTASFVLGSKDPLVTLVQVVQDFPKLSAAIARRTEVDQLVYAEVNMNQNLTRLGHAVWINGRMLKPAESDIYKIMDVVHEERKTMQSLMALGLNASSAFGLLVNEDISQAMTEADPMDALVDASDRREGGGVITWWNDLEKDKKYASFSSSVSELARAPSQGQFFPIKRNIWNVILVLDLSSPSSLAQIYRTIKMLISRKVPFRFGTVPLITDSVDDRSWKMFKLIHKGLKLHGRAFAMDFLEEVGMASRGPVVDMELAQRIYSSLDDDQAEKTGSPQGPYTLQADLREKVLHWLSRVGATPAASRTGTYFFNGAGRPFSQAWTQSISQDYSAQMQYLKQSIGKAASRSKRIDNYFYDLPTTSRKRNPKIIPGADGPAVRLFDTSRIFSSASSPETQFMYADPAAEAPISLRILADIDSPAGLKLLQEALLHLQESDCRSRLAIHHFPGPSHPRLSTFVYQLLSANSFSLLTPKVLSEVIERIKLDRWTQEDAAMFGLKAADAGQWSEGREADLALQASQMFWTGQSRVLAHELGILTDAAHLMVNGRLIGPLAPGELEAGDFSTLSQYEGKLRINAVQSALEDLLHEDSELDRVSRADIIASASSILAHAARLPDNPAFAFELAPPRLDPGSKLQGQAALITFGEGTQSLIRIYAVLDPLTEAAQKWSAIIKYLSCLPSVSGSVRLNPVIALDKIPLKRFYRYETRSEIAFDVDGQESKTAAVFDGLPGEPIFTLGLDVAASWIVSPRRSVHDLDNLRLDVITARQGSSAIGVIFELEQFAIEGHAQEAQAGPPRGLQLQLQDLAGHTLGDTQVMANLGYFQLKAKPGVMQLSIRPGRGSDIYTLNPAAIATDPVSLDANIAEVALASFSGLTVYPVLHRRYGMELADVLDESSPAIPAAGLIQRVRSIISAAWSSRPMELSRSVQADINIFTVASGMLYERFASIMILSVLRHTNSTVKFWFIGNFLSPTFLTFLPEFSARYGFQYEVVTYRWPSWLRAQTEKQREIWAYKILFLDVLFPMGLDKILFVDADQIVRTDLKELVDLDLQGHVYGYAPMGDDKPEMEGFRFWKQGYWKDSLRGRPYHISALYVIDLKRFRQVAAGDRLRAQYQALSGDPNSLANLDQDLPNSMQDTIPIFTLDKSWLWCETWCSQDSLKEAKTIDLCQNPLTKEPKLERARKIPEWDEYDREVADFTRGIFGKSLSAGTQQAGSADEVAAMADAPSGAETLFVETVNGLTEESENGVEGAGSTRLVDEL